MARCGPTTAVWCQPSVLPHRTAHSTGDAAQRRKTLQSVLNTSALLYRQRGLKPIDRRANAISDCGQRVEIQLIYVVGPGGQ